MKIWLREMMLDHKWSAKVKQLKEVLLRCCLSNRFRKRIPLEVFHQPRCWLKVFSKWAQKEEWKMVILYLMQCKMQHILPNQLKCLLVESLQRKEMVLSDTTKMVPLNLILIELLLENFMLTRLWTWSTQQENLMVLKLNRVKWIFSIQKDRLLLVCLFLKEV